MFGPAWNLIVCVCFFTLFCEQTSSECTQLTPCSCMFPDGHGYDLSPLRKLSPLQTINDSYTFYFHPCTNKPLSVNVTSECFKGDGVSLCAQHGNTTINLGRVEDTHIEAASDQVKPSLIIHHENYTSSVTLFCCDSCTSSHIIMETKIGNSEFRLLLVSPYACKVSIRPKGLSIGSILVLNFFIITGVYFIGGAMALKFLRGATGWEMVPNHTFWGELSSLVKDGIAFTFSCCRIDSYDRI
ncbi:cation-dependent mannose-6-phosphate receptor [Osmia lignaria lignaria]|uniref:cation-dependent mannose-6-phosphate receptor n=1 Tax=Osmia lignaria lignaria TaxID=1437193 RepID=UPI001478D1FF|nr:cation-dependent mannose-6-phosphate receptor-like [Osmia lignaria]